jgi:hypothetical protein
LKDWEPLKAAYATDPLTTLGGQVVGKIQLKNRRVRIYHHSILIPGVLCKYKQKLTLRYSLIDSSLKSGNYASEKIVWIVAYVLD